MHWVPGHSRICKTLLKKKKILSGHCNQTIKFYEGRAFLLISSPHLPKLEKSDPGKKCWTTCHFQLIRYLEDPLIHRIHGLGKRNNTNLTSSRMASLRTLGSLTWVALTQSQDSQKQLQVQFPPYIFHTVITNSYWDIPEATRSTQPHTKWAFLSKCIPEPWHPIPQQTQARTGSEGISPSLALF